MCLLFYGINLIDFSANPIKEYRLHVYNFIIYHLNIVFCAYQSKSNLLPSFCTWPFTISSNTSFPLVITMLLSVSTSFVCLVCLCVAFSFISYVWVKSYGSWLFLSDFFHLAWYSQALSMLSQMALYYLFLWLSSSPLYICPHLPYPTILLRTLWLFPCLDHHE